MCGACLDLGYPCPAHVPRPTWAEEMPTEHYGVRLEPDDGGLWVTVTPRPGTGDVSKPYWIGPRALAAIELALKGRA